MDCKQNLFVYGTLQDAIVQRSLFGRAPLELADALEHHVVVDIDIEGRQYPAIVPGEGTVKGFTVALTRAELAKADHYEGEAYRRIRVKLKSGSSAWVYIKA